MDSLKELMTGVWHARTDRGAEHRLEARERSPLIPTNYDTSPLGAAKAS